MERCDMTKRTCKIDGCDRPHEARGWCDLHNRRWRRNGDPLDPGAVIYGDDEARFWSKVEKTESCWLWTGPTDEGYGRFFTQRERGGRAHRWSYEHHVGPIPDGLQIDHLCRVRRCVRPDHLEAVTQTENVRRGESFAVEHAQRTHCVKGHELSGDNLATGSKGRRICRECSRIRNREYRARLKAARAK